MLTQRKGYGFRCTVCVLGSILLEVVAPVKCVVVARGRVGFVSRKAGRGGAERGEGKGDKKRRGRTGRTKFGGRP